MSSPESPPSPEDSPQDAPGEEPVIDPGASVLDAVGQRTGRSVKVSLTELDSEQGSPIIDPRVRSVQDQLQGGGQDKYQVLGEIARGGMGVVLRGHDKELGRDVAMKVVHGELADRPEVLERFVEEAQVGGQLQHPGIVPVYELGLLADQRPYFTMKLVKGRTLAKMLSRRKSAEEDRARFLSIFEAICQTMAYAHSKGVIHRDIKPANVMVGGFGEVQVVDWGLSKVLSSGGVADELAAQQAGLTVIETLRSGPGSGSSDSLAGNVLGTPAYMAPEQAQGKVNQLDERADVFALGAVLCEILTGGPPYVAGEGGNLVRMAAAADLEDALARIEAATAPEELKQLCRACLQPAKQARPDNAEELAQAIHDHLAGLESAAHTAQLAAAEDRVRAERSRRKLQLTLVTAAMLAAALGGWWWVDAQREASQAAIVASFDEVRATVAEHQRAGEFERAADAAANGVLVVEGGGGDAELRARATGLVATAEAAWLEEQDRTAQADRERALQEFLTEIELQQVDNDIGLTGVGLSDAEIDAQYSRALGEFGLGLEAPDLAERLEALRDTELGLRIAHGFDGWGQVLRRMGVSLPRERRDDIEFLTGIGLDLDSDPMRAEVRLALVAQDDERLLELERDPELARDPALAGAAPETFVLLGRALDERKHVAASRNVLVRGAELYPSSFLLNFGAARALSAVEDDGAAGNQYLRAIGYLRAAISARPGELELSTWMGDLLRGTGDSVGAAYWAERVVEMAPDHTWNEMVLGLDLFVLGRFEEAAVWFSRDLSRVWNRTLLRECEVYLGQLSAEEMIEACLAESKQPTVDSLIGPASYLISPRAGEALDPERSLALLESVLAEEPEEDYYWRVLACARLLTGDGAGAVAATRRVETLLESQMNRRNLASLWLLRAAGHRLEGEDEAADVLLERARSTRDGLISGAEEEWRESWLLVQFKQFEAMAAGD